MDGGVLDPVPVSVARILSPDLAQNYRIDFEEMFTGDQFGANSPADTPNPRVTLEVENARETDRILRLRGVTISDPVERYGGFLVGAFLDSEGNKLWFCSDA